MTPTEMARAVSGDEAASARVHLTVHAAVVYDNRQRLLAPQIVLMASRWREGRPRVMAGVCEVGSEETAIREARGKEGGGEEAWAIATLSKQVTHNSVDEADIVHFLMVCSAAAMRCVEGRLDALWCGKRKAELISSGGKFGNLHGCHAAKAVNEDREWQRVAGFAPSMSW